MKKFIIYILSLVFILYGCKKKYPKGGDYYIETTVDGNTLKSQGQLGHSGPNDFYLEVDDQIIGHYAVNFHKSNSRVTGIGGGAFCGSACVGANYSGEIKYSYYHLVISGDYIENEGLPTRRNGKFKIYRKRF